MNQVAQSIHEILAAGRGDAPAIAAPSRPALTYAGLRRQAAATLAALGARGIGRGDRVAIVLPNGPEMASAFLSVGSGAATAPLNPGYRAEEFQFYLGDLRARAVMVERGSTNPVLAVARDLGLQIVEIAWSEDDPAGRFDILGSTPSGPSAEVAGSDEPALLLHTSGTTSRPKLVPLLQRNVAASAHHIAATLALTPDDRCMNIMPLFHIHGLMAATLASVAAGASVFCCPGFNALRFFAWLEEARPTWYTAVPTMHQAILSRAARNREAIARTGLRFIRSSSASLPPAVMQELEITFGAPVIESYGMTEAAHQMASNPLPPAIRKPGSVGMAAGPDVRVMSEDGRLLDTGMTGEVVIRGANVTPGYEGNPSANAAAFTDGWFRTGDQGILDAEGYLTITGRLKEIINRGGEKVAPSEVDNVIQDHPAVQQVVTFAMPHLKLGEEVAAAIVLREGMAASEHDIKEFAAERLADFKVPRYIVFLAEIPKGATGKMQRIGLAEKLGLSG